MPDGSTPAAATPLTYEQALELAGRDDVRQAVVDAAKARKWNTQVQRQAAEVTRQETSHHIDNLERLIRGFDLGLGEERRALALAIQRWSGASVEPERCPASFLVPEVFDALLLKAAGGLDVLRAVEGPGRLRYDRDPVFSEVQAEALAKLLEEAADKFREVAADVRAGSTTGHPELRQPMLTPIYRRLANHAMAYAKGREAWANGSSGDGSHVGDFDLSSPPTLRDFERSCLSESGWRFIGQRMWEDSQRLGEHLPEAPEDEPWSCDDCGALNEGVRCRSCGTMRD